MMHTNISLQTRTSVFPFNCLQFEVIVRINFSPSEILLTVSLCIAEQRWEKNHECQPQQYCDALNHVATAKPKQTFSHGGLLCVPLMSILMQAGVKFMYRYISGKKGGVWMEFCCKASMPLVSMATTLCNIYTKDDLIFMHETNNIHFLNIVMHFVREIYDYLWQ